MNIADFPRYETYKDSGVEWLGEIPKSWEQSRLKLLVSIKTGEKDTVHRVDNGKYPFFIRSPKVQKIDTYSFDGEAILTAGDGDIGKIFHYIKGKFDYHQRVYKFSDFKKVEGKYLYYYLQYNLAEEVVKLSAKTTVDSLRLPYLQNFVVAIPGLEEQKWIYRFLDKKTTQIDEAIAIKEQQIALLKERKKIIIQKTVTQGLDPNVPMKDSGVDWIGEIPAHWDIKKLRYLGVTQNGISAGAEYFGEGSPFVSYGDVYKNRQLPELVAGLAKSTDSDQKIYSVVDGDVFFTRTSETVDEIGFASICFRDIEKATFAGFLIRFRPRTDLLIKEFSKYYFNAELLRKYFVKEMNLVIRASLSQELLKNLSVVLPPVSEQLEIYKYLEKKLHQIDDAISIQILQIEKLKEYKTTLINSAVTGKIRITPDMVEA